MARISMKRILLFLSLLLIAIIGIPLLSSPSKPQQTDMPEVEQPASAIIETPPQIEYTDPWADIPGPSPPSPLLEQKGILRNPGGYAEGECELAARDWQREYGGEMVFIAPLDAVTGAWIRGDYAGAWINHKNGLFVDYFMQRTYASKEDVSFTYAPSLSQKLGRNAGAKVYIQGIDTMPYAISYHYS